MAIMYTSAPRACQGRGTQSYRLINKSLHATERLAITSEDRLACSFRFFTCSATRASLGGLLRERR